MSNPDDFTKLAQVILAEEENRALSQFHREGRWPASKPRPQPKPTIAPEQMLSMIESMLAQLTAMKDSLKPAEIEPEGSRDLPPGIPPRELRRQLLPGAIRAGLFEPIQAFSIKRDARLKGVTAVHAPDGKKRLTVVSLDSEGKRVREFRLENRAGWPMHGVIHRDHEQVADAVTIGGRQFQIKRNGDQIVALVDDMGHEVFQVLKRDVFSGKITDHRIAA